MGVHKRLLKMRKKGKKKLMEVEVTVSRKVVEVPVSSIPGNECETSGLPGEKPASAFLALCEYHVGPQQPSCKKPAATPKTTNRMPCTICKSTKGTRSCTNCYKAAYCSKAHQHEDWKEHKTICYPCIYLTPEDKAYKLVSGPFGKGPFYKASREIGEFERILENVPLMTGPGCCLEEDYRSICLSCTKPVSKNQKCSRCNWPLCGPLCEKKSTLHVKYECEILEKNQVYELFHPFQYELIRILRCLLMKEKDTVNYNKLITLEGALEQRKTAECLVQATTTACMFINQNCRLKEFDRETIDKVCGIVDLQTQVFGKYRSSMGIYTIPANLSHSCSPNCRFVEVTKPSGSHHLALVALRSIDKEEVLTFSLLDMMLPLVQRMTLYRELYYFQCRCPLCYDSSEFGSWFSALKCTEFTRSISIEPEEKNGKTGGTKTSAKSKKKKDVQCGHVVMKFTRDLRSNWRCTICKREAKAESIFSFMCQLELENAVYIEETLKLHKLTDVLEALRSRIVCLKKRVPAFSYLVARTKLLLLAKLSEHLQTMDKPEKFCYVNRLTNEAEELGVGLLSMMTCFHGGTTATLEKGLVLYHIVIVKWCYVQWAVIFGIIGKFMDHKFAGQWETVLEDAWKILSMEVDDDSLVLRNHLVFAKNNLTVIQSRLKNSKSATTTLAK